MKAFAALSVALLILGIACQAPTPNTNPAGIDSGIHTVSSLTTSPYFFNVTYGAQLAAGAGTPYFVVALISQIAAPATQYKIIPSVVVTSTVATVKLEFITSMWTKISYSWIASMGEPLVAALINIPTSGAGGQYTYDLPPSVTTRFPKSSLLKIDTLLAGFDYRNTGSNKDLSICIQPFQIAPDPFFNDFVTAVDPVTNLPNTPGSPLSVTDAGALRLAYTVSFGSSNPLVLNVAFALVIHSVVQRTVATVLTGYNVKLFSAPQTVLIVDSFKNTLSVVDPQKIFGTSCLQFANGTGVSLSIDVPQAQIESVSTDTSFVTATTGVYMYTNPNPCGGTTAVNFLDSITCSSQNACSLSNATITLTRASSSTPVFATISFPSITVPTTVAVRFSVALPTADNTSRVLVVSSTSGTPITYESVTDAFPTLPNTKVFIAIFTINAGDTVKFEMPSLLTTSTVSLVVTILNVWKIDYYLKIDSNNAQSCTQTGAFYTDPTQTIHPNPMLPFATRTCTTGNNLVSACNCPDGTYLNQGGCTNCIARYCKTCAATDPTKCITGCQNNRVLSTSGRCECPSNSVESILTGVCTLCPSQCATCTSSLTCITCALTTSGGTSTNRKSELVDPSCGCVDGYYDDGRAICQRCPTSCVTCQLSGNTPVCTSCNTVSGHAHLDNGICVCDDGYYKPTTFTGTCSACHVTCLTCIGPDPTSCTSCTSTRQLSGGGASGSCPCRSTLFTETNQRECTTPCTTTGCVLCPTSISTCTGCSTANNFKFSPLGGACTCKDGFFLPTTVGTFACATCPDNCAVCSSIGCSQCFTNATATGGICSCPPGTYSDLATTTCISCSILGCITCPRGFCTVCADPFIPNGVGGCKCKSGTRLAGTACVSCPQNCTLCSSSGCITCNSTYYLYSNGCVGACPTAYTPFADFCAACASNCLVCDTIFTCSTCSPTFYLYNGGCIPAPCPGTTFLNVTTSTCVPCNAPCENCTGNANNCTSCRLNSGSLQGNTCGTCTPGTTSVDRVCVPCNSSRCVTCFMSPNYCTSCNISLHLFAGNCLPSCPANTFYSPTGTECWTECLAGTYPTGFNCVNCSATCITCSGFPNNCTRCPTNQYLYNGFCNATCPSNTVRYIGANGGVCLNCSQNCATCSSPDVCQVCVPGNFQIVGGLCVQCLGSTVINPVTGRCDPCPTNCITCTNSTYCTNCSSNTVNSNGVCYSCLPPCATCSGGPTSCATCIPNYVLSGTTCNTSCPLASQTPINGVCQCITGYFYNNMCIGQCPGGTGPDTNKICRNCSDNCNRCPASFSTCTECRPGWDLVNGACVRSNGCMTGEALIGGTCTKMCEGARLFFDGFCVDYCPMGYKPNANYAGCIVQDSSNVPCQMYQVYAYGGCYSICPAGTYLVGNVCVNCSSNCFTCVNNTYCTDCAPGYYLSGGSCLASAICVSPQLALEQACLNSCPEGTFANGLSCDRLCGPNLVYHQGLCYDTCRPPFVSNGFGCVSNCPAGQTVVNGRCTGGSTGCGAGFFFNQQTRRCDPCQPPCATCIGSANLCTSCLFGVAVNGQCQNTGGTPNSVITSVASTTQAGNQVHIELLLNYIPQGLSNTQQGQMFLVTVVPTNGAVQVYQWVDPFSSRVHILLNFSNTPSSRTLILGNFNIAALATAYYNAGYTNFQQASFQTSLSTATTSNTPTALPPGVSATFARSLDGYIAAG